MRLKIGMLFFVIVGITLFVVTRSNNDFPANAAGAAVTITVDTGESGSSIAAKLERAGVIKSGKFFISLAIRDARAKAIGPGVHTIERHIPAAVAITELLDQKRVVGLVIVKEGSTYSDVLADLKGNSSVDCTAKLDKFTPYIPNKLNSLEGQIFPAQYSFTPKTTCSQAIKSMAQRFAQSAASIGLNTVAKPYEVLTIASMVQIEGDPRDFGKVARTIYNRLKIGMPLQLNSTVQYAAHLRGRIAISTSATQIHSPYNTYKYVGLPPTPISNPSVAAISATLNPDSGSWLYFITVKPGDTRFTNSYSEFSGWEVLYHKNLSAGAFK